MRRLKHKVTYCKLASGVVEILLCGYINSISTGLHQDFYNIHSEIFLNPAIIEWCGLERTLKIIELQPLCLGQGCHPAITLPRAPSSPALITSMENEEYSSSEKQYMLWCSCLESALHLLNCSYDDVSSEFSKSSWR